MEDDLDLSSSQYNTALTIFFVSYCTFEVPSNVLMKKFKPKLWSKLLGTFISVYKLIGLTVPMITLAWGLVMTLTGIRCHNF